MSNSKNILKNKKLLFVVNDTWFFVSHRLDVGIAAKKYGMDVHLAALTDNTANQVERSGIKTHHWKVSPRSTNLLREFQAFIGLVKIFLSVKPDIVHLVTIKSVLYGGLISRFLRTRSVVFAISGLGHIFSDPKKASSFTKHITLVFYKIVFAHPNCTVIVQNKSDFRFFEVHKLIRRHQLTLIRGSGVNTKFLSSINTNPLHLKSNEMLPIVVLASRMLWDKGIQIFVDAASIVNKEGQVARFVLIGGSDSDNPRCVPSNMLKNWAKEGHVEWWGHSEDIITLLSDSDIFVLPTVYGEGVPKVLIEASALGLPIVASDWPGCREIIQHGVNGLLTDPGSSTEVAEAIIRFIKNPEFARTLGSKARKRAIEELDIKHVISSTCQIYTDSIASACVSE